MDIQLHYEERGEGFPLVLLHGNGEDGSYFFHQMDYFSPQYRVIAVDTRGHGRSPRGTAPFTIHQFAEDLKEFLDGLGLTKIHLLGFSDGGNIALAFALRYPQYIEKLILNGANLEPSGVKASCQVPITLAYGLVSLISRFDPKAVAKRELLGLMVTQPHFKAAELATLTMPALVIAGNRDLIREAHSRTIAESLGNGALRILPGDHFVAARSPEAFNRAVEAFLSDSPPRL